MSITAILVPFRSFKEESGFRFRRPFSALSLTP